MYSIAPQIQNAIAMHASIFFQIFQQYASWIILKRQYNMIPLGYTMYTRWVRSTPLRHTTTTNAMRIARPIHVHLPALLPVLIDIKTSLTGFLVCISDVTAENWESID